MVDLLEANHVGIAVPELAYHLEKSMIFALAAAIKPGAINCGKASNSRRAYMKRCIPLQGTQDVTDTDNPAEERNCSLPLEVILRKWQHKRHRDL